VRFGWVRVGAPEVVCRSSIKGRLAMGMAISGGRAGPNPTR
jgi:hypothetical protein